MAEQEKILSRKRRIRAGHRASATRLLNQVDAVFGLAPVEQDKLTLLKLSLKEKLETLKKLDSEIIELTPEDGLEAEINQSDEYNERSYAALIRINVAENVAATPTGLATPTRDAPQNREAKVKLPKITLSHFDGDPMKWTSFWDSFKSAIHDNPTLSEVDKFNYLKSLLEHSAYDTISGLSLSAAHYQTAIELLQKRFGDNQLIISRHMETLLQLEAVQSDQHLRDLRRLYNNTESHIRSLRSLGVETAGYGAMLSPIFLSKLPSEIRLVVSRKVSFSEMTMNDLLEAFEEELVARERAARSRQTPRPQGRRNQDHIRHSTLLTKTHESETGIVCCFCKGPHLSKDCSVVKDVNDRRQSLKSSGRCFNCLRKGHLSRACRSASKCQHCRGRHHTSLCERRTQETENKPTLAQPTQQQAPSTGLDPNAPLYAPTTNILCLDQQMTVLLQTARAVVYNPMNSQVSVELRLLFDTGSQRSYITERAVQLLDLKPVGEQMLSISTFASQRENTKVCPVVNVNLCLKGYSTLTLSLYAIHNICEPLKNQPITACIRQAKQLEGMDWADCSDGDSDLPVDVLIGSDHYWELVTGSICKIEPGLTAIHTKLGWVFSGHTKAGQSQGCAMNLITTHVLKADTQSLEQPRLEDQLKSFWELESLGIRGEEKTLYDEFTNDVVFRDGRYSVSLPWKEFHEPLHSNYALSLKRLRGLLSRLRQSPDILHQYDGIIRDQLDGGIIEAVPGDKPMFGPVHYLPHHAVLRHDKATTKLRIVYDASARGEGPSLNDCLQKGPKFNQLILDLLLRFRSYRIALTADVEKAFLMISVEDRDRDVLRFLWVDDVSKEEPKIIVYRFTRVVFGVSSSPFLLNATIRLHLEGFSKSNELVVKRLLESTYVDDVISGANTTEEAFELYSQSKLIFGLGGFNLRKFVTNSKELQQKINCAEDRTKVASLSSDAESGKEAIGIETSESLFKKGNDVECRVLGLSWVPATDCLPFNVTSLARIATGLQPTKRNVVSLVGRFYDPIGFLSPIIIKFKILFQKLCHNKMKWDDNLPEELLHEWRSLIAGLEQGIPISIPRSYFYNFNGEATTLTLCGFCDASAQAYAAVIYLMLKSEVEVAVRFVVAKTRVAPLRSLTIPRLELLSAYLLSKLIVSTINSLSSVLTELNVRCYTDSMVALYWICGTQREWKPFVQNRVDVIRRNVKPENWSHCPGRTNPADLPSRGLSAMELSVNQLWREGPEWLRVGTNFGLNQGELSIPEESLVELKSKSIQSFNLLVTEATCTISNLIDSQKFSSLTRLLRVTARVLWAIEKFKTLLKSRPDFMPINLTQKQITSAELLWIKDVQAVLIEGKDFKVQQKQFNLFQDERGVWRCGGRLGNVEVPFEVKYPIILPRIDYFSILVVQEAHQRVLHNGVRETLTELRRKFWIPKARSLTRRVVYRCLLCKRHEGLLYKPPPPPPLPTFRVKEHPGFTYTGVDFAGPLNVHSSKASTVKVWICLFTCLVTRAVHLDAVPDLSTQSFIRCLKRFVARRGLPARFLSDNGKTFKAADKYLKTVMKDSNVNEYLTGLGIEWMFNVERAPWWGGAFERMIGSTKRCLRKVVNGAHISLDELTTILAETEAVLNSRPLSYVTTDDTEEPLTPSHLLLGRRILNLPDHLGYVDSQEDLEFTLDTNQLMKRMKYLSSILNHFWNRWRTEYLAELREIHSSIAKRQHKAQSATVCIGDIVIVHDDRLPRGLWKLGKIVDVMKGRDSQIRGAVIKMATKDGSDLRLKRPIQLLFPLEVNSAGLNFEVNQTTETCETVNGSRASVTTLNDPELNAANSDVNDTQVVLRRSQRTTTQRTNDRRRACEFQLEEED